MGRGGFFYKEVGVSLPGMLAASESAGTTGSINSATPASANKGLVGIGHQFFYGCFLQHQFFGFRFHGKRFKMRK